MLLNLKGLRSGIMAADYCYGGVIFCLGRGLVQGNRVESLAARYASVFFCWSWVLEKFCLRVLLRFGDGFFDNSWNIFSGRYCAFMGVGSGESGWAENFNLAARWRIIFFKFCF